MQEDYYPSQQFPIGGDDDDDDNDDDDGDEVKSPFACVWQAAAAKAEDRCLGGWGEDGCTGTGACGGSCDGGGLKEDNVNGGHAGGWGRNGFLFTTEEQIACLDERASVFDEPTSP
jgi:hypothetical protein